MDTSPKYSLPWDLISESLTGVLSETEELQLQQWLSSDPDNKKKFSHLKELWENGMEDYKFYQMANEKEAWKTFHAKLEMVDSVTLKTNLIQGQFNQKKRLIRNLIAIAAVFLGLVGIGLWFILSMNKPIIYETASNVHKNITLDDGSTISLNPLTKIEVSDSYNKSNRTVIMSSGEAHFEVGHHTNQPFIVELGNTRIKDIGTSFTIQKSKKEINVSVTSGIVVFEKLTTKEIRELTTGTSITFNVENESFDKIKQVKSSSKGNEQMLNFENTPLSDVIISIQKVYGKKIIISDTNIANKKITAQLDGMPYSTVMKVICKSLGLVYSLNDSVYILKEKN